MKTFPGRLHHKTPAWVPELSIFHVRISQAEDSTGTLTDDDVAKALLNSFHVYNRLQRWSCMLAVLMPDHLHALLSFGRNQSMSVVVKDWKSYHKRTNGIKWQDNYFDHRIRTSAEYTEKYHYMLRNPVALGLCSTPEEWPWKTMAMVEEGTPLF